MNTHALMFSPSHALSHALRSEGGLFSPDLLEALTRADLAGQKAPDFGLPPRRALTEEIAALYHDARALWQVFQHRLERLPEGDLATSETRELWVVPFLRLLGYDLHYQPRALEVDGVSFPISHLLWGEGENTRTDEERESARTGERESTRARDFSRSHPLTLSSSHPLTPIHIVGYRQELGRLAPSGRPRLSPHALVQEYLNRSEALWGLVTNGRILRLLRDSTFVRRQAYVEFDLESIFEEDRFADFVLLYRLLHRTRLPGDGRAEDCLLEQYYQQSVEQGGRVREHLREGVERCLELLANGFLSHPANERLRAGERESGRTRERESGRTGEHEISHALTLSPSHPLTLSPSFPLTLYQQLLRLVYRLLFLLVSEERGLMGQNPLYLESYGISRLRRLCENRAAYTDDADLWLGLRALWRVFQNEQWAAMLGVPPLNGELFAHQELDDALIANRDLLTAFWYLTFYDDPPRRVNYAALDTEELGSVYESLLDYHPTVALDARGKPQFALTPGSERKSTGSYYTPPQLVGELIRSALEPVIAERLKEQKNAKAQERALLSIKVCDPACGSGHFLLAAARRLGKELARIRTGEDEPAPEQVRAAIRDVMAHCIYGVDKNPLAVELARVALWLESHAEGKPLTFLEHRIKRGDSLVGVFDLSVLHDGLPDEAFAPLEGDDKKRAAGLKKQNQAERDGQLTLFSAHFDVDLRSAARLGQELDSIPDDSPEQVRRKRERYESRWNDPALRRQKQACDLWTAAFFQQFSPSLPLSGSLALITTDTVRRALAGQPVDPQTLAQAAALAAEARFFHWPLEFPEVFAERESVRAREYESVRTGEHEISPALPLSRSLALQPGFDVILANPPWERIKLQEQEFFASRDARIANAPNAAARKRLIERLPQENPALWEEYRRALHTAESASRFLRASGDYPLTARGDINTYSVFAERIRRLLAPQGRAGVILPTGIATDATNQFFFADLVEKGQIHRLVGFENEALIFPDVHHAFKFCALTIGGEKTPCDTPDFAFFCRHFSDVNQQTRHFQLSRADIAKINPNTRTMPVFRTRQDAELTKALYARVPVLVNETTGENAWRVTYRQGLFHSSNDATLFNPNTKTSLTNRGGNLSGNVFFVINKTYLPFYEGRMIWHYDHRFGSYEQRGDERGFVALPETTELQHQDPNYVVKPFYWVSLADVEERLSHWKRHWLIGFRDVTSAVVQRTAIFSLLPRVGVADQIGLLFFDEEIQPQLIACLLANANCFVFDYVVRQKVGSVHLKKYVLYQFPVLPPAAYTPQDLRFIVPRVLELTYTAWDLAPFAADVWRDADESLRAAILESVRDGEHENMRARERESPALPLSSSPALPFSPSPALPIPPYTWNADRRARLRAELDAYYARLYGLTRKQLRYILDPADLTERELADILDPWEEVTDPLDPQGYAERAARSDFPGETFRVLKEKELREYGEYRTRRLALAAWEAGTHHA